MSHPPRYTLERLATRDLPDAEAQLAREHLQACATCHATVDLITADSARFAGEVPYPAFRIEHERRHAARRAGAHRRAWWLSGLAAAATLLVVLPLTLNQEPDERIKGPGVALSFAVLDARGLRPGQLGERLGAGAKLQLAYDAGSHSHMAVFGIDGHGTVTLYYPQGDTLAPVPVGRAGVLPFSLTLDAAPGAEHFVALFADDAAPIAPLLDALRHGDPGTGAAVTLPDGMISASVWIMKP